MLPAAGPPLRPRPGLSRRRSSACAAARPGAPAGHRTRPSGLRRRSRALSAAAGGAVPTARRGPSPRPGKQGLTGPTAIAGGPWVFVPAVAGTCYATLAQEVLLLLDVLLRLGPGRRFGAKAPRHQPEASSACPRGQGPLPAPGGPVPGPDGGLGNNGDDRGHPFGYPRGPDPVQTGHQEPPAAATGPRCHHQPSRHCRPGGTRVPISRAAATRTLPPGGPLSPPG